MKTQIEAIEGVLHKRAAGGATDKDLLRYLQHLKETNSHNSYLLRAIDGFVDAIGENR